MQWKEMELPADKHAYLIYSLVAAIVSTLHGVTSEDTYFPPNDHPGCGGARLLHLRHLHII